MVLEWISYLSRQKIREWYIFLISVSVFFPVSFLERVDTYAGYMKVTHPLWSSDFGRGAGNYSNCIIHLEGHTVGSGGFPQKIYGKTTKWVNYFLSIVLTCIPKNTLRFVFVTYIIVVKLTGRTYSGSSWCIMLKILLEKKWLLYSWSRHIEKLYSSLKLVLDYLFCYTWDFWPPSTKGQVYLSIFQWTIRVNYICGHKYALPWLKFMPCRILYILNFNFKFLFSGRCTCALGN